MESEQDIRNKLAFFEVRCAEARDSFEATYFHGMVVALRWVLEGIEPDVPE